jgi:beta-glucanase (GH16 family)
MKFTLLCFLPIIINPLLFSQVVCEGDTIYAETTFDQCLKSPWLLVFEDNFDGDSLDSGKWRIITKVNRDPYYKLQKAWLKEENVLVNNGVLKIVSKRDTLKNQCYELWVKDGMKKFCSDFDYSTAEIWTKPKFSFGKIEARVKIPKGKGLWPAFWMFDQSPIWNELDVFEFAHNNSSKHYMAVHYDYNGDWNDNMCGNNYSGQDFSEDFHIYTVIWEKNEIQWYVDGVLKRTDYRYYTLLGQPTGCIINQMQPYIMNKIYPKDPMHIIFNTAIESGGNAPDSSTPFPCEMEVDWVKYYQREF